MRKLLAWQVASEANARRFSWGAAFLLIAASTALVLRALPGFSLGASIALMAIVTFAWVILGWQLPQTVRGGFAAAMAAEMSIAPDANRRNGAASTREIESQQ